MSMMITVVVPVFKHWELMPIFFEKMRAQTLPHSQWELLVVDNGSPVVPGQDELPSFARLLLCEAAGSYAARNVALKHATGQLIIFTDADCQPEAGWLESHWAAFQKSGSNVINAGAVTVKKLTFGVANDYELFDSLLGIPQERYATRRGYAVTANLAVPQVLFVTVGDFDATRLSGGDAEFCQRAQKRGAILKYVPEAKVLHPARSSWQELETKARRVKGGQLRNGPYLRRVGFFFKSFLYPVMTGVRVIKTHVTWREKIRVLRVVACLSFVEIKEVFLLILGRTPERR